MLCASLLLAIAATTAAAQGPRREACDLLSAADVEAVLGVSPLRAVDPASRFRAGVLTKGKSCGFEKVEQVSTFTVSVSYTDAPDADAVLKYLAMVEKQTYNKPRAVPGFGDAAFYEEPFGNPAVPKTLTIFVGGTMTLSLGSGTNEQLRTLAEKALRGTGATGFAYHGAVPTTTAPARPTSTASSSPLDQLKAALTKKADSGDSRAEEALAGLYRFSKAASGASKPDYQAAAYWYKRASDHGAASASYQLATMYHEGIGLPVNDAAAKALFTKAADAGYVPAMVPLAFMYASQPDFVSKRRAGEWAMKAAEADDPEGHLITGYLWDTGLFSFDDGESGRNALSEYRKAADKGNCLAMLNTGGLYFNGSHGLKQDAAQAQAWFDRAQSCFGRGFEELQQKAVRYRSLAASGHLPVPQAPPPLPKGSRFFTPKSGGQSLSAVAEIVRDILELTTLSVAYLVAHPEEAAKLSAPNPYGTTLDPNADFQHEVQMNGVLGRTAANDCLMAIRCR
jgi:TPR repeat protein